ncbi:MAG: nucleotidyltransferase domain-containing protein [Tibeticola sp.]
MCDVDQKVNTALMARQLAEVPGIVAVVLGGSRARGTHHPDSDVDIGIYYQDPGRLDLTALNRVAQATDDAGRCDIVCTPGGWGPWVDAGGWLTVEGHPVDWILRELPRVERVLADCHAGRVCIEAQAGHPFGFVSAIYVGELAVCHPLADAYGDLDRLRSKAGVYPDAMARGIVDAALWEVGFNLALARKALDHGDTAYLAGCAFRAIMGLALSLHALNRQHWLNEKGAVAAVAAMALRPVNWRTRVDEAMAAIVAQEPQQGLIALSALEGEATDLLRSSDPPLTEQ